MLCRYVRVFFSPPQGSSCNRATSKCSKYTLASHPIFDFRFWGGKSGNSRFSSKANTHSRVPKQPARENQKPRPAASPEPHPPQCSHWGGGPALSPIASRVPRVLRTPHARRARVAIAYCFEPVAAVRAACQTRATPRKETRPNAVDEVGDRKSGLILPVAAPEAPRADRSLLSAIRHELFNAGGETSY